MGFGDLKSESGLKQLNDFLADKSYIDGFVPSQSDAVVYSSLAGAPAATLQHALRWYNHITSFSSSDRTSFPGEKKSLASMGGSAAAQDDDEEDDDVDLFGSDDEEENAEAERLKAERIAAYNERKSQKKTVIAKSSLLLDVKPWDDETDMADVEKHVRGIKADGLVWGASKLILLAYGIKKLQIACVIEDEKISTDFLEEEITANEDLVQSMDIAAFNKI